MTDLLTLPTRLGSSEAPTLLNGLLDRRGRALTLDASGVEMIGALSMEVIVAAGQQWAADGLVLDLAHPSDRFAATCATLGLRPDAPWLAMDDAGGAA